jgi:hypothetical protein
VGRSFLAGLGIVVLIAAVAVVVLRPAEPPPAPIAELDVSGVTTTARAVTPTGPPPSREDLLRLFCRTRAGSAHCAHELMTLYRACGIDVAHPRTPGCADTIRRVRHDGVPDR